MKIYYSLCLILFSSIVIGQNSTYHALNAFIDTPFFEEFAKLRDQAEDAVLDFKVLQSREGYTEDEISEISKAYDLSADRFNRVLQNIKMDMMDKQMRKYIASYPEGYGKQIETDFNRAKDYYTNTFQREIINLTDGQVTGAAFLVLIPQIIGYIDKAVKVYKIISTKLKKVNEDMIDKYMIEPYRFKTWDEV